MIVERLSQLRALKKEIELEKQRLDKLMYDFVRQLDRAYASICGHGADKACVARRQEAMADVLAVLGVRGFTHALRACITQPHRMGGSRSTGRQGAYSWIVLAGVDGLRPAMWQGGPAPRLVYASRAVAMAAMYPMQAELYNRRRQAKERYVHRNMRYADPRQRHDTRHRAPVLKCGSMRPGERIAHVE